MTKHALVCATGAAVVVALAASSPAAIIASWNFNDSNTAVDSGSGTLFTTAAVSWIGGTVTNALPGVPSGQALSFSGTGNNNRFLDVVFSTAGMEDPILTLAWKRNNNGYNSNQVSYSTDGSTFIDFGSPVNPHVNTFGVHAFDLSGIDAVDNQSSVYVRIRLNGASNNSGNNAIDNINVDASPVPTPGSVLLTAMGVGILAVKRRRR